MCTKPLLSPKHTSTTVSDAFVPIVSMNVVALLFRRWLLCIIYADLVSSWKFPIAVEESGFSSSPSLMVFD